MNDRPRNKNLCFFCFRFPGKALKGKKYKPLFPYFSKVCSLCVLLPVWSTFLCLSCLQMKTDPCLTIITCRATNWHLGLWSLNLLLNLFATACGSYFFYPLYLTLLFLVSLQCGEKGAFQVVIDNYVKEEEGTGVVHQAPYFGAVSGVLHCDVFCCRALVKELNNTLMLLLQLICHKLRYKGREKSHHFLEIET